MEDKMLDAILSGLAHPVRRKVVSLLAVSGGLSYSELLRHVGVESSVLSFHLRKLKDFIERDQSGIYKLNSVGKRASSLLDCISGAKMKEGVRVEDSVMYYVGEDILLEAYKRGGLEINNVRIVVIGASVSGSLLGRTLRSIANVLVVYAPYSLFELVESRAYRVSALIPFKGKLPVSIDKPSSVIRDLESRGYIRIAHELKEVLGYASQTSRESSLA